MVNPSKKTEPERKNRPDPHISRKAKKKKKKRRRKHSEVDHYLSFLPSTVQDQVQSLSQEDKGFLAYYVSITNEEVKGPNEKIKGEEDNHPRKFGCLCLRCYSRFIERLGSSPNSVTMHNIIGAFDIHINSLSNNEMIVGNEPVRHEEEDHRDQSDGSKEKDDRDDGEVGFCSRFLRFLREKVFWLRKKMG